MPNTCFVPGCNSGYKSCKQKRHLFKVGKRNEQQLQEWARLIPRKDRPFTFNDRVCDLHFDPRFIRSKYTHVINGETVEIEMGKLVLTDDAKPTIFPNLPKYLTKKLPPQRASHSKRKLDDASTDVKPLQRVILSEIGKKNIDAYRSEMASQDYITLQAKEKDVKTGRTNKLSFEKEMKILKQKLYKFRNTTKKMKIKSKKLEAELAQLKQLRAVEESLTQEIESLPEKEHRIVQHVLRRNKSKSGSNGMRYDTEWILDCILLYIRFPSGYEFLRCNNYLPLPSKTTLCRYITSLDAMHGFDKHLFTSLKLKLEQMPEHY